MYLIFFLFCNYRNITNPMPPLAEAVEYSKKRMIKQLRQEEELKHNRKKQKERPQHDYQVFEIIDFQHSGDLTWREMENGFTIISFDDWTQIFKDITAKRYLLEQRLRTLQKPKSHKTVQERPTKRVKKIKKSLKKEEPDTSVTTLSSMIPHMTTTFTYVVADISITEVASTTTITIELSLTAEIATSIETAVSSPEATSSCR
ncbi:hypothetical protein RFI_24221 [Reticulomyxa filosa]|uniref:Uncharacterized protein n=1 Tax=Reticulomyxa filosa TaxID=46433 RepID=X6MGX9_RETFI|nr:hypothetical protein RFI_24221 [Reticulomyxa filosa]|eukprot:ETO13154.1 hypothetical protein RFI_24221 [Reticulomyxa filosa]